MIEVRDLRRVFTSRRAKRGDGGAVVALDGVSFTVEKGETYGILGPNGAGKTTLTKILSTTLLPTSGSAWVAGYDVVADTKEVRRRIGIVFGGDRGLYDRITARQNLVFWATLYRVDAGVVRRRVDELLEQMGLAQRADEPVERFSRGMRQRLHLARGLLGDPAVLFLDEPTVGMDPIGTREFRELVGQLRAAGRTLLLTTHDMREAEALCDRVTLVDHGRILLTETTANIGRVLGGHDRIDIELEPEHHEVYNSLLSLPGVERVEPLPEQGNFRVHTRSAEDVNGVLRWLAENGVSSLQTGQPDLEEVYVHLIGKRGLAI